MMRALGIFAVSTFFLWSYAIFGSRVTGQERDSSGNLHYSAGSTITERRTDGTIVKVLSGGVTAHHHDVSIRANRGLITNEPGQIHFTGRAELRDSVRTIHADSISYFEKGREARASGNMRAVEKDRRITAGEARYHKENQTLHAFRGVVVTDDSLDARLTGREMTLYDSTGYGIIVGDPFLEKNEKGKTVTISGRDSMQVFREERLFRVWNAVEMQRDSIRTFSDRLEYVDDDSVGVVTLTLDPRIEYEFTEERDGAPSMLHTTSNVSGDSIVVYLKDRRVTGADVMGSAVTTTTSLDSTGSIFDRSVIESNHIKFTMDEEAIDFILASGFARSYYHRRNPDSGNMFVNVASGDTLYLGFDRGKMKSMKIIGAGGGPGRGTYYDYSPVASKADSVGAE